MGSPVSLSEDDLVVTAIMDDGKANALSTEMIAGIRSAVTAAAADDKALVLAGRPGRFCAGFDLSVVNGGDAAAVAALMRGGAGLFRTILEAPIPVVAACTGHSLAGGALLLVCADYRVGPLSDCKIGLPEVAIKMALPGGAIVMARYRLATQHLTRATLFAELAKPERAVEIGWLNAVADDPVAAAIATATQLAQLPRQPYATTKRRLAEPMLRDLDSAG